MSRLSTPQTQPLRDLSMAGRLRVCLLAVVVIEVLSSSCPEGKFHKGGYVKRKSDQKRVWQECTECWAGLFSTSTFRACHFCPGGYISKSGAPKCTKCSKGKLDVHRRACQGCPPGKHMVGDHREERCSACSAGHYSVPSKGCLSCPMGQSSPAGASFCSFCPRGYISNKQTKLKCKICSYGQYKTSKVACTKCPSGKFALEERNSCQNCAKGQFSHMGQSLCIRCKRAHHRVIHMLILLRIYL
jgi:hypothetical protein